MSDLPLNTPTKTSESPDFEVWETRTSNGQTLELRPKPGSTAALRTTIEADLLTGLGQLQQILDAPQITFSNLAGAQTASQQIQTAVKANARQLRRLTRLTLGLLDAAD